mmetsp:Transcript_6183/g.7092  ORF Transcript_6183/g.7092 Transcript_6183/m.7092 type:complete len:241 (-) Transcript_6183:50-772(-)
MKFTSTLFSLAVVATTTTDHYGVHGMSDDMENTTDTTASASSDEEYATYCDSLEESLGDTKTGSRCIKDWEKMYKNLAMSEAYFAWTNSLQVDEGLSTEGGNSSYSYTSSYSDETTAAYKEACEKGEGNIWTAVPDQSFQCRKEGEDKKWNTVNVAVSNNGVCLPGDSENCNSIMADNNFTAADFADNALYEELSSAKDIYCNEMQFDDDETDSGGVVTSTPFIGSLVAATAVLAFTVLI